MKQKGSKSSILHFLILCVQGAIVGAGAIKPTSFDKAVTLIASIDCFAGGFLVARWMDIWRERQGNE